MRRMNYDTAMLFSSIRELHFILYNPPPITYIINTGKRSFAEEVTLVRRDGCRARVSVAPGAIDTGCGARMPAGRPAP